MIEKNEEYQKYIDEVVENMSVLDNQGIAGAVGEIYDQTVNALNSTDPSEKFIAHVGLTMIGGYIASHAENHSPSPIMITGRIISQVEQFIDSVNRQIKELENEND